ncbi:MAG TPA: hypothetical protein VFD39_09935, partial [Trueperaceae bacterium]|nr:hypothetical protein [Trueperaceae bacterium]
LTGRSPRAERENGSQAVFTPPAPAAAPRSEDAPTAALIEERELVPVARGMTSTTTAAVTSASSTGATTANPNPERGAVDSGWPGGKHLPTPRGTADNRGSRSVKVIDDADFTGAFQGTATVDADRAGGNEVADHFRVTPIETDAASADVTAADADRGTGHTVRSATGPKELETAGDGVLEDDVRRVDGYLRRPETPAIVRSDFVAERLGLHSERCERALERLSENHERVSRIRKGAYMIRRDVTRQAED